MLKFIENFLKLCVFESLKKSKFCFRNFRCGRDSRPKIYMCIMYGCVQHRFQNFIVKAFVGEREGRRRIISCKTPQKTWAAIQEVVAGGKRCSLTIILTIIYNFFNFTSPNVRSLISRNLSVFEDFSSSTFFRIPFFPFLAMNLNPGIFLPSVEAIRS